MTKQKRVPIRMAFTFCGRHWVTVRDRELLLLLCRDGLSRYVDIPTSVENAELVFSKRRLAHSFRIAERLLTPPLSDIPRYYIAAAPREETYGAFNWLLRRAYKDGYRYVRIEHD